MSPLYSVYSVDFAGLSVPIGCDDRKALAFLDFLFGDLHDPIAGTSLHAVETAATLTISLTEGGEEYTLADSSGTLFAGSLNVQCAAVLFDQVIFSGRRKEVFKDGG